MKLHILTLCSQKKCISHCNPDFKDGTLFDTNKSNASVTYIDNVPSELLVTAWHSAV